MDCNDGGFRSLAFTGLPGWWLLLAGAVLLLLGVLLVLVARRRRRTGTALLVVLACVASVALWADTPAHAAGSECDPGTPVAAAPLAISQTSVLSGLAPGVDPVPVTGVVANNGTAPVTVTAVTVSIGRVGKAADAVPGTCDAGDYVLTASRMPVGTTLDAGESATFAGATLGFNDKSTNQDACKGARVDLHYVAS